MANKLTFDDFRSALQKMRDLGALRDLVPRSQVDDSRHLAAQLDDDVKRVEAIIEAMTLDERRCKVEITESRRRRIAAGSGSMDDDVRDFLQQFVGIQRVCEQIGGT